jgi:hypothetical protein
VGKLGKLGIHCQKLRLSSAAVTPLKYTAEPAPVATPVIPATREAEIGRIPVQSQPGQLVHKPLPQTHPTHKRAGEWLKMKAPSSSPSTAKKNHKKS